MGEESRSKTTPFTFGVPYGEEKQDDDWPNVVDEGVGV